MVKILDGRDLAQKISEKLKDRVRELDRQPVLAIVQVGERKESNLYIEKKKEFGEQIGAKVEHHKLPEDISQKELENTLENLSKDKKVNGIILQLPLPESLNFHEAIEKISCRKDVDGLTSMNVKKLWNNELGGIVPATTRGVLSLLDFYNIKLEGKNVVVLGRSVLVGKPIAISLLNRDATVTLCHSRTENLKEITKKVDILIVALGKANFIDKEFVSPNQVIIDIGINTAIGEKMEDEIKSQKPIGDVNFDEVKDIVEAISPVPGGVGPLTVACLFDNLLDALEMQNS